MAKKLDLSSIIGKKINSLILLKEVDPHITKGGNVHRKGLFICDCGTKKEIQISSVINGITKSCGCFSRANASKRITYINKKHGMYGTNEYSCWVSMKKRCLNKSHKAFFRYGGRGITICKEWIESFDNFFNDMGNRPSKLHSLDRIDNDKGYYKENCKWSTNKEQTRNQSNNLNIKAFEETKCLSVWASILGFSWQKLYYRLFISKKYSLEKMLNEIGYSNRN